MNIIENRKETLLNGLDKKQRENLLKSLNKNSLVLAGAGSGKTRLLTTRLAYIMDVLGVHPSNIVCFTFTKKAATEMSERMKKMTTTLDTHMMLIGTYHSVCLKIIAKYHTFLGLDDKYTILDPYNSRKKIKSIMQNLNLPDDKEEVSLMVKAISDAKNKLMTPQRLYSKLCEKYKECIDDIVYDKDYSMYKVYKMYCDGCLQDNQLDFDDIIVKTIEILQSCKEAQIYVRNTFKYILADEVQDSNPANIMLLALMGGSANVFMVGDLNQSIYGWRGARPDLIMGFVKKNNMQILKLEQNYRSTQTIVNASNALISHNDNKVEMNCFSHNDIGEKIVYNSLKTNVDEAQFVASKVLEMTSKGYSYKDIMVLYRTNSQSRVLEDTFMNYHIPYYIHGSTSFVSRMEVKDCMAFLRLAVNTKDKESFRRILSTLSGIGYTYSKEILNLFDVHNCAKATLRNYKPKTNKVRDSLMFLYEVLLYESSSTDGTTSPLVSIMKKVSTYYLDKLSKSNGEDTIDRISNINELYSLCEEKSVRENMSIEEFVRFMDVLAMEDSSDNKGDAVQFMTMHSSKGLEAPVVFIIGMNENILPHANSLRGDKSLIEQERQLAYVACTRAEKQLFVTRYSQDQRGTYEASRFIGEIPFSLVNNIDDVLSNDATIGEIFDKICGDTTEIDMRGDESIW